MIARFHDDNEITEFLGRGGMGVVMRGFDPEDARRLRPYVDISDASPPMELRGYSGMAYGMEGLEDAVKVPPKQIRDGHDGSPLIHVGPNDPAVRER